MSCKNCNTTRKEYLNYKKSSDNYIIEQNSKAQKIVKELGHVCLCQKKEITTLKEELRVANDTVDQLRIDATINPEYKPIEEVCDLRKYANSIFAITGDYKNIQV